MTLNHARPRRRRSPARRPGDRDALRSTRRSPSSGRVVAELEAGGLSLEDTIARTERAVALQRHCERLLGEAELRVRQLVNRPGGGLDVRDIAADEATEG